MSECSKDEATKRTTTARRRRTIARSRSQSTLLSLFAIIVICFDSTRKYSSVNAFIFPTHTSTTHRISKPATAAICPILRSHQQQQPATRTTSTTRLHLATTSAAAKITTISLTKMMITKFMERPGTFLMIPVVASFVGWITNWLAVQMIFYPIKYRGLNIWRKKEIPLGLLGWQGIIPCKTRPMTIAMVTMVQTQLLSVSDTFYKLDPNIMATLLAPQIPQLTKQVLEDDEVASIIPTNKFNGFRAWFIRGLFQAGALQGITIQFLKDLTISIQENILNVFSLQYCVVTQMMEKRSKLGELFQKCGQKELTFLIQSGVWFGAILGIIQMFVALLWENPWSLSIGGGIVGFATNWLALKWIFKPVEPITLFGKIKLQGMFLRRQKEVSYEFSKYFANEIVTSKKLWNTILTDPKTKPTLIAIFTYHLQKLVLQYKLVGKNNNKKNGNNGDAATVVGGGGGTTARNTKNDTTGKDATLTDATTDTAVLVDEKKKEDTDDHNDDNDILSKTIPLLAETAVTKYLQQHVDVTYSYMDQTLGIQDTLQRRMERMSGRQFERVLHPIFEEDELTLILAGAALGFVAGFIQQLI